MGGGEGHSRLWLSPGGDPGEQALRAIPPDPFLRLRFRRGRAWGRRGLSQRGVVPPAGKALIFDPEDQNHFLLEDTMDFLKALLTCALIVVVVVAIIWAASTVFGTPSVVTVQPDQIPTIPEDGVSLLRQLLGL